MTKWPRLTVDDQSRYCEGHLEVSVFSKQVVPRDSQRVHFIQILVCPLLKSPKVHCVTELVVAQNAYLLVHNEADFEVFVQGLH